MLRWAGPSLEGCVHVLLLTKRHTATALNHTYSSSYSSTVWTPSTFRWSTHFPGLFEPLAEFDSLQF